MLIKASPALFENRKKCPDFGKKGPDCIHVGVKFSIQNINLRVSRRKNSKIFPFFLVLLMKCLSKCPKPPSPALKLFWFRICTHYSFCKTLNLKCLTVF